VIGEAAAAIHGIETAPLAWLPGPPTRHAHAETSLAAAFAGLPEPEAQDALAWAGEHLPPETPSVLLHGDLLGQNILLHPNEPPAVIDWERAELGDTAYDLAIVTRGVRQPFQIAHGLERLLEAYRAAGGVEVTLAEIRVHELCLAAHWYRSALQGQGSEPPAQALARLRRVLTLASGAS
jgi:aminoglycoside phosphotransferase (APT) family kinase protein